MRSSPDGLEMLRMIETDDFGSALITGCPGSGKTTVSVHRFLRLAKQNQHVYLLTFHNMLMLSLQGLVRNNNDVAARISTFHQWYRKFTNQNIDFDNLPSVERIRESLAKAYQHSPQSTELILDEAQDLPIGVIEALSVFFARCVAGADDSQQVHKDHGASISLIQEHLSQREGTFVEKTLGRNFRNTYETYAFARQFIPRANQVAWDETILERLHHENRHGAKPLVVEYRDTASRDQHLRTVLDNAEGNVAILCPLGPSKGHGTSVDEIFALVRSFGISASKYHHKSAPPDKLERYVVTTYISAKGLEFDTVVIPRINFNKRISEEWYVACTRARKKLVLYRDLTKTQYDPIIRNNFNPQTFIAEVLDTSAHSSASPF